MDWNRDIHRVPFVSRPAESSLSSLYNYNYDHYHAEVTKRATMTSGFNDDNNITSIMNSGGQDPRKKRMSNEQLEQLENSFQDEVKLDPDRKMKLAKELGLHPRQIAVWFQNRKARWKSKQLERLYDALKQEYDAVCRDKLKLQQEVIALRSILNKEHMVGKSQTISNTGYMEMSMESTSTIPTAIDDHSHQRTADDQCNNNSYPFVVDVECDDDYNNNIAAMMTTTMHPYWGPPSCP